MFIYVRLRTFWMPLILGQFWNSAISSTYFKLQDSNTTYNTLNESVKLAAKISETYSHVLAAETFSDLHTCLYVNKNTYKLHIHYSLCVSVNWKSNVHDADPAYLQQLYVPVKIFETVCGRILCGLYVPNCQVQISTGRLELSFMGTTGI